ncbi:MULTISPECIES: HEAT repeat domain-containing protein [Calothrix]|uniref:HEAT repeat domain-containing protein n=2 Tax=Calothrix TaxID=1186 RepID=A0ABR8AFF6_9CYAN|nr:MULTISPECIES: HEAT repeat domain-containing protein [Calothrix]MBD2198676.1 HEAT repeat domain-containing protein [Calothrix parietina FACHB-288]MBD2228685.1 HEAT repeat domain-containing protein [Calothrix anomala FACHB-343]
MPDYLNSLIRAVEDADSSLRLQEAVKNLAASRLEGAIPTLIASLSYNNPGAAVAAVDGLIQIGEPAVPALLELLDLHNYTARSWAIRALAGIGDPRGLVTLLGAATADFALSVRRAAAKGLGMMKWHWFPEDLLEIAQAEAMDALLFVAKEDDEWVVRYSAVVGLQFLADAVATNYPDWRSQIQSQFEQIAAKDDSWAVKARVLLAQQHLQKQTVIEQQHNVEDSPSPLSSMDWQKIMEGLYGRKGQERQVFAEGDPRRYEKLAVAIAENSDD